MDELQPNQIPPVDDGKMESEEDALANGDEGTGKKSASLREQWKNPAIREKYILSIMLAASAIVLGMFVGQHGPTFLDIQLITNTDIEAGAVFFTFGNSGYLTGCILTGIFYNKMNKPLLMFLSTLGLGISNVFIPYCSAYKLMMMIRFIAAGFAGCVDTGLNSEHMRTWGSEANGILQFLHFCFSMGGFLAPLIAEPFLAERIESDVIGNETFGLLNSTSEFVNSTMGNGSLHSNTTGNNLFTHTETRVHYLFLIIGLCSMVASLPFFWLFFKNFGKSEKAQKAEQRRFTRKGVPFPLLMVLLCGICLFYFTYCCVEDSFFSFLMTFLVEEYDEMTKSRGAFATAVAWAAFATARFLMIFLTKIFTTMQLLFMMTITMAIAFTSFAIFAHFGVVEALIILGAMAALSCSGVFPSGFSWMETEMFQVTGIISSCILVSSTLGSIINPLIIGFLMKSAGNMWFCYMLVMDTYILIFLLVILLVFSRYYIDRKYGTLASSLKTEVTIEPPKSLHSERSGLKMNDADGVDDNDGDVDGARVNFIQ